MTSNDAVMGITGSKGVHFTFANGYTLSVQIGMGNYCENRNYEGCSIRAEMRGENPPPCVNAEIAVWPENGAMLPISDCDTVRGWYPINCLPSLMLLVSRPDVTDAEIINFIQSIE